MVATQIVILLVWVQLPVVTPKVFGDEVSMVMQWTVNPPTSVTTGSIPVVSTKFRLVSIMVITADCLSAYGSSILPRVAKLFQCSTAVVQLTVNQLVVGSIPATGASIIALLVKW